MEEKPKNVFEILGCSLILPLISQNLLLNLPLNFLAVPFIEKWELCIPEGAARGLAFGIFRDIPQSVRLWFP